MSYIEFDNVSFGYGQENVIENFSLKVKKGEFLVLIGPSGCGKSTLLSLAAGLRLPKEGSITIDGRNVEGPSLCTSVIFQHYSLFPWMTVEKNVRFGIRQSRPGIKRSLEKEIALEALTQVGMEKDLHKYPFQLSGGMQQRTAIARTLAMDSEILLMDEPFGAVDPKRRAQLQELLVSTWQKTILFVTHDIDEAVFLADRILYLGRKGQYQELLVPLPRPRQPEKLTGSECFCSFRKKLVELFAQDGGEES